MAHEIMFDDADPVLRRVRQIALALPEAAEKISHGQPAFYTQKVFCYYGGPEKIDGEWMRHNEAILVLPDPDDEPALRQDSRFWTPGYLGPSGWLGLDIDDGTDWTEIAELIDASFRVTAPRRLVRSLDARTPNAELFDRIAAGRDGIKLDGDTAVDVLQAERSRNSPPRSNP